MEITPELIVNYSNSNEFTFNNVVQLLQAYSEETNKSPQLVDKLIALLSNNLSLSQPIINTTLEYFRKKYNIFSITNSKGQIFYYL